MRNFITKLDPENFSSCIERGMELLENIKIYIEEVHGGDFNFDLKSCRWSMEQAVINRQAGTQMMAGVIEYVESVEARAERYNDINQFIEDDNV